MSELHRLWASARRALGLMARAGRQSACALRAETGFDRRNSASLHCSGFAAPYETRLGCQTGVARAFNT
jgi:hypothetical protein